MRRGRLGAATSAVRGDTASPATVSAAGHEVPQQITVFEPNRKAREHELGRSRPPAGDAPREELRRPAITP